MFGALGDRYHQTEASPASAFPDTHTNVRPNAFCSVIGGFADTIAVRDSSDDARRCRCQLGRHAAVGSRLRHLGPVLGCLTGLSLAYSL